LHEAALLPSGHGVDDPAMRPKVVAQFVAHYDGARQAASEKESKK
jgi:hypothetical protein